jgi:hypothetical protein
MILKFELRAFARQALYNLQSSTEVFTRFKIWHWPETYPPNLLMASVVFMMLRTWCLMSSVLSSSS